MINYRKSAFIVGAGMLAAGGSLAALAASPANAATSRPSVVKGLAVKVGSVTTSGVTLTWDADSGARKYRIMIFNASTPTAAASYDSGYKIDGTSTTISTLSAGTAYQAEVEAEGARGDSSWSPRVMFYTNASAGEAGPEGPAGPAGSAGALAYQTTSLTTGYVNTNQTPGDFGSLTLGEGVWQLTVSFNAGDPSDNTSVYPEFFVSNGPAADNADYVLTVGGSALVPGNISVDSGLGDGTDSSTYSGTATITVPAGGETLDVYEGGISAGGAVTYTDSNATFTAVQLSASTPS